MKQETINSIKENFRQFIPIVKAVIATHQVELKSISVVMQILKNMSLDVSDTSNYSLMEDISNLHRSVFAIKEMANYHKKNPLLSYVADEVDSIVWGHEMVELHERENINN